MLVLVIGLLAMIALLAATFLLTTRYDQVGTASLVVSNQMEMLLGLMEGDLRRRLAEDMWGSDPACNGPGDDEHEAYDAPDTAHGWLRGICGKLIGWEPQDGDPADDMQYVVDGAGDWRTLGDLDSRGLQIRFAVLIQDLGGLVNLNVARRPDPDLVGQGYAATPSTDHPEDWPYSIWAFHARRNNPDWGYWWYRPTQRRNNYGDLVDVYGGMGKGFRGGGPLGMVNLRWLVEDDELKNADDYFRSDGTGGRSLDIQDELDLRHPGRDSDGAPYVSMAESLMPSLFASRRRRFATAVGRTANFKRRREPVRMHPYDDPFWDQCKAENSAIDKSLCHEWWYMDADWPHYQDLIKYQQEDWMGHRISLQRGVSFSRMVDDEPFSVRTRLETFRYETGYFEALCKITKFPTFRPAHYAGGGYGASAVPGAPPFQYDGWITDWQRSANSQYDEHLGGRPGPVYVTLLMANAMAMAGVPSPEKDPEDADSFRPLRFAHTPAVKTDRVKAYRKLAGAMHLNMTDHQDRNETPSYLHTGGTVNRFSRYGDFAADEDHPYISEIVIEFGPWPSYCSITQWRNWVNVKTVDKGTGAELAGLKGRTAQDTYGDRVLGIRKSGDAAFTPTNGQFSVLRNLLKTCQLTDKIDLQVLRTGATRVITNIPLEVGVYTIAVEVYNPHDHPLQMLDDQGTVGVPRFRYNVCVPQQYNENSGERAFFCLWHRANYMQAATLPARSSMVYLERRDLAYDELGGWMGISGLGGVLYHATNKNYSGGPSGNISNLVNMRPGDGELLLAINAVDYKTPVGYAVDAVRHEALDADGAALAAPPMPHSDANPGTPAGIADAFAEAKRLIDAGSPNPVVRLYRPRYMESRATQFMQSWQSWNHPGADGKLPAARLGKRDAGEDNFTVPGGYTDSYRNIDARGVIAPVANRAFRFGGDLSRVSRLVFPRLRTRSFSYTGYAWFSGDESIPVNVDETPERATAPTEHIDRQIRAALAKIPSGADLTSRSVRQILQKAEARLRFSPYSPTTDAEQAECAAWHAFLDGVTVGGAAYDNIDNNGNSVADEHGTDRWDFGLDETEGEFDPGGAWMVEHSNCWPAYGRLNVNTAPRDVLRYALMAPSDSVRRALADAICDERGTPGSGGYRPFKSLGELYRRVSVLNGHDGGFDRYGFDGEDNHNGAEKLPDMDGLFVASVNPQAPVTSSLDPYRWIDDLDERNYLWRINSELITLRSDTFAVYLRFQARRQKGASWQVVAERRVFSIWDRAVCLWPPNRHDGTPHPDFAPPQRLGIQIFGH